MDSQGLFNKYKNIILNCLFIFLGIFISFKIYNSQMQKVNLIIAQKDSEMKKNEILKEISKDEKEFAVYRDFINKKDVSSIIDTVREIAKESSVEITYIKPLPEVVESLYIRYPFDVSVISNSYHDIGKFIAKLESHPDIFSVVSISMSPQQQIDGDERLTADLQISTILLSK